jgi:hypothetical protein
MGAPFWSHKDNTDLTRLMDLLDLRPIYQETQSGYCEEPGTARNRE